MDFFLVTPGIFLAHETHKERKEVKKERKQRGGEERKWQERRENEWKAKKKRGEMKPKEVHLPGTVPGTT